MSLYLVPNASPNTISALVDHLHNQTPSAVHKWGFEIKLYREKTATPTQAPPGQPNFLYTLAFSQHMGDVSVLVNGQGSVVKGALEGMLQTKMQSLWQLRQAVRGEGSAFELPALTGDGQAGATEGGRPGVTVRVANLNLQGTFKGLLVEVECPSVSAFATTTDLGGDGTGPTPASSSSIEGDPVYAYMRSVLGDLLPSSLGSGNTSGPGAASASANASQGKLIVDPPGVDLGTDKFGRLETAWQYAAAVSR